MSAADLDESKLQTLRQDFLDIDDNFVWSFSENYGNTAADCLASLFSVIYIHTDEMFITFHRTQNPSENTDAPGGVVIRKPRLVLYIHNHNSMSHLRTFGNVLNDMTSVIVSK